MDSTEEANPESEISDLPIHCDSLPPIKIVNQSEIESRVQIYYSDRECDSDWEFVSSKSVLDEF